MDFDLLLTTNVRNWVASRHQKTLSYIARLRHRRPQLAVQDMAAPALSDCRSHARK
jgi:hypothetical protein